MKWQKETYENQKQRKTNFAPKNRMSLILSLSLTYLMAPIKDLLKLLVSMSEGLSALM